MVFAGEYNINIVNGTNFENIFEFPYNISASTFEGKIKNELDVLVVSFTCLVVGSFDLKVTLTASQTLNFTGLLSYDIIESAGGIKNQVMKGLITNEESVTL